MTNKQRQKSLDKKKWLESEKQGFDMSGCMLYCSTCEHANHDSEEGFCKASQALREKMSLCATAYNRMWRGER